MCHCWKNQNFPKFHLYEGASCIPWDSGRIESREYTDGNSKAFIADGNQLRSDSLSKSRLSPNPSGPSCDTCPYIWFNARTGHPVPGTWAWMCQRRQSPANDPRERDNWHFAGIYISQDNPALWVEKRWGGGWTINLGHPHAKREVLRLLFVLLLPIAIISALTYLWPVQERYFLFQLALCSNSNQPNAKECFITADMYRDTIYLWGRNEILV